jgi:predicted nucleotidyltransferase
MTGFYSHSNNPQLFLMSITSDVNVFVKSSISDEALEKEIVLKQIDSRPLYERLEEQKQKEQEEYDNEHKFTVSTVTVDEVFGFF